MANFLEAYRTWRLRSRLHAEAKHLVSEARHILDRKNHDIPRAVVQEIEEAVAEVESARQANNLESLRHGLVVLDERMDEHLAFARKSTVREYSESIVVAVAIALLLRAFVIEAFQIPSGSMIPTLEIGDHIFVSKFAYGIGIPLTEKKILPWHDPQRGDVIVFRFPEDKNTDYIKRVVGLPGDKVEVRRNEIFINGKPMPRELVSPRFHERGWELWREYLDGRPHHALHRPDSYTNFGMLDIQRNGGQRETIPPKSVFVMGDNRDDSNDSRVWGFVPYELIKGKALIVWWSRDPAHGGFSPSGVADWFGSIRWRRFFHLVD
jgi:signal peptidase I